MHFEILVEGQTELTALSILMEKIVGPYDKPHTWKIHKHRGIGKLPENPEVPRNKKDPTLLYNLPWKLRAYGKDMSRNEMVVVLVDLDDRADCRTFKQELANMLDYCTDRPRCLFRIAIEELEAWFLGDLAAVEASYPSLIKEELDDYVQDSQCGTWEKLADAIHPGGMEALGSFGKRSAKVLEIKRKWAAKIAPRMEVEHNRSPSFRSFRDGLRKTIAPT
ncbi:MAG: DUF4276 family protein [Magnetococcales bacterium]|nr:DUF4276 family protein [Magnetococcales bacterium]